MSDQAIIEILLFSLLLLGSIFSVLCAMMEIKGAQAAPAPILCLSILLCAPLVYLLLPVIVRQNAQLTLLWPMMLGSVCLHLALGGWQLHRRWDEIKVRMLLAFLFYLLMLVTAVIFGRSERTKAEELLIIPFASFTDAAARSYDSRTHMLLNVLLFVPFGALLPQTLPERWHHALITLIPSAYLSAVIETAQWISRRGVCDVDDLIANAFGGLLGYYLFRILRYYQQSAAPGLTNGERRDL